VKKNEKGFTLLEVLATFTIISILLSLSGIGVNCVLNNTGYQESINDSKVIQLSVDNYYNHKDVMPVGEAVDDMSEDTKKLAAKKIGPLKSDDGSLDLTGEEVLEMLISSGSVYELDYGKMRFSGEMTKENVENYVVIYVKKEGVLSEEFMRYNTTIIKKDIVTTCSGDEFNIQLGKIKYENISEGLKFKINEEYIECPNPDLCNKLEENE
jgi:prepilin-type N-terminal cleavage/methylation domain-containing protein